MKTKLAMGMAVAGLVLAAGGAAEAVKCKLSIQVNNKCSQAITIEYARVLHQGVTKRWEFGAGTKIQAGKSAKVGGERAVSCDTQKFIQLKYTLAGKAKSTKSGYQSGASISVDANACK